MSYVVRVSVGFPICGSHGFDFVCCTSFSSALFVDDGITHIGEQRDGKEQE